MMETYASILYAAGVPLQCVLYLSLEIPRPLFTGVKICFVPQNALELEIMGTKIRLTGGRRQGANRGIENRKVSTSKKGEQGLPLSVQ